MRFAGGSREQDSEPVFSSQTFVGIESGRQSVDLSVSLNFTVNEAAAEIVTDNASTTETSRTDTTTTTGGWTETSVTVTTVQKSDREWEVTWEKEYTYPDPEPETPEKPEEPETPDTPEVPGTPPVEPPVEDIPVEDVPKTDIPVEVPDVPAEDEPLVEIPDEDVPAADIPGLKKLPRVKELNAEYAQLLEQKRAAYPAYRKARTEMQEYLVAQKVAAVLLEKEKEQAAMEEQRKEEQRTDPHR